MASRIHDAFDVKTVNLSYYCRGCKQMVRGIPLTTPQFHISELSDDPWLIVRCPTRLCELSFIIYDKLNDVVRRVYPYPNFSADNFHEAIPENVREDLAEAKRCFYADAYKGTMVMYRRAIQNIALDKIKTPGIEKKKIWEQIDELFNQGLITKNLQETGHEIRHFGNFGAHPSDDALDNTTRDDAEAVSELVRDLVVAIYITPHNTAQLKSKRTTP